MWSIYLVNGRVEFENDDPSEGKFQILTDASRKNTVYGTAAASGREPMCGFSVSYLLTTCKTLSLSS